MTAAAWRGFLAAVLVAVAILAGAFGPPPALPTRPQLARLAVLWLAGGPVFIVLMNLAVAAAGATIASFVAGLYAVLGAVLAPVLLRERLTASAGVGFVLALAGTLLLAELAPSGSTIAGIVLGLGAALAYALFLVLSRRWSAPYGLPTSLIVLGSLSATAVAAFGWAIVAAPASVLPGSVQPDALVAVLWLAVAPGIVAQFLVVIGVRRLHARRSSAFLLLNPISAAVFSWLLLGERLSAVQLLGAAATLAGIATASGAVDAAAPLVVSYLRVRRAGQ